MINFMKQVEERHLATKVDLMVWCNKMDLLALSNTRGEVSLHRLTWRKVWTLAPPSESVLVKGIAWRPDGKVIAIAYSTYEVLLIDVENKQVIHKAYTNLEDEVTHISWVQEDDLNPTPSCTSLSSGLVPDTSTDFLPKLMSLSRIFGSLSEGTEDNLDDAKRIRDQLNLNFLIVGLKNGLLYLSTFGLFPVAFIDTRKILNVTYCSIANVELSKDLKMLIIAIKVDNLLKIIIIDTNILSTHNKELHALSIKHGQIINLLDYLSDTMQTITETWENMLLLDLESKLTSYADSLPEGSVSADFLELLMLGTASEPLQQLLMRGLTEKGIKKLGHSIELSHSNIQKLILNHLHAVVQNLAYYLSEMKGMARMTDRYQILGLEEEILANAFKSVGTFLVKGNEMLFIIDDSLKKYKALFRWLYGVILKMADDRISDLTLNDVNQQELSFIADYLYNLDGAKSKNPSNSQNPKKCCLDRLGQYLIDEELPFPPDISTNKWEKLLKENPCLLNNPAIIPRDNKSSLIQQYNHLKKAVNNLFDVPHNAIESLFKTRRIIPLDDVREDLNISLTHICNDQRLLVSVLHLDNRTQFKFFVIPVEENTNFRVVHIYFNPPGKTSNAPEPMKIIGVLFYLPEVLSILLESTDEERKTLFLHLPTKPIREAISSTIDGILLTESSAIRPVENMVASSFAVSGIRKVAVVLSENRRKVRLFEMDVEDEEEEDENMDTTCASNKEADQSAINSTDQNVLDTTKDSDIDKTTD